MALNWRRLRDRFGIAAPRVAVRTHLPWYWRGLGAVLLLTLSVTFGAWLYDIVRQTTRSDRAQAQEEVTALRARVGELEKQLVAVRGGTEVAGSALQIERTTQEELARQVKVLEETNGRLREELALFEKLASAGSSTPGPTINGLHVEPDGVPGRYRYRLLVALQGTKKEREFRGSLQVIVALQQGAKRAIMVLPAQDDPDRQRYLLNFRYFRRIDGTFQVPEGARPTSVEVRVLQDGATKTSQSTKL
jgi:uncharacterized protein DUF6776